MPDAIPLPPDDLMTLVSGHADHAAFARSRERGPRQLLHDLTTAGMDPAQIRTVLDLGCGAGRFLAGWCLAGSPWRLYGCDVNPRLVGWCQETLPTVCVRMSSLGQPLPYEDAQFDLIYALSVVTHLPLAVQLTLLAECRRLLRPGGVLYLTFHGAYYYAALCARVPDGEARLLRDGCLVHGDAGEGSNDCWTLHRAHALVQLCAPLQLVCHLRSGDRGPTDVAAWQDSLILQKPAAPGPDAAP